VAKSRALIGSLLLNRICFTDLPYCHGRFVLSPLTVTLSLQVWEFERFQRIDLRRLLLILLFYRLERLIMLEFRRCYRLCPLELRVSCCFVKGLRLGGRYLNSVVHLLVDVQAHAFLYLLVQLAYLLVFDSRIGVLSSFDRSLILKVGEKLGELGVFQEARVDKGALHKLVGWRRKGFEDGG